MAIPRNLSKFANTVDSNGKAPAAGSTAQLQYNNAGIFEGAANIVTDGSNLTINAQGDLRFGDSDSSNWVGFQAPATVSTNVTWTLPNVDGSNGQALTTDGTGTLTWATVAGAPGGSTTQIQYNNAGAFAGSPNLTFDGTNLFAGSGLYTNATTFSSNYTIPSGVNSMSAGPITINAGVVVTVPAGQRWTIL